MITGFAAIIIQICLLLLIFSLSLYFLSMVVSDFFGVPFVPTSNKVLNEIFSQIKINKKTVFYDLGCGDGRLIFYMAKKSNIKKGVGIEINPLLHFYTKLKTKLLKLKRVEFYRQSLFEADFSDATIIYLFLFPEILKKLRKKLVQSCRKKTIIVSHGFKIKGLGKKLIKTLKKRPFPTYYYQL